MFFIVVRGGPKIGKICGQDLSTSRHARKNLVVSTIRERIIDRVKTGLANLFGLQCVKYEIVGLMFCHSYHGLTVNPAC